MHSMGAELGAPEWGAGAGGADDGENTPTFPFHSVLEVAEKEAAVECSKRKGRASGCCPGMHSVGEAQGLIIGEGPFPRDVTRTTIHFDT